MSKIKELVKSLREMDVNQLQDELLSLRRLQFNLRLKVVNGVLSQTHLKTQARKTVARLKTLIAEKQVKLS